MARSRSTSTLKTMRAASAVLVLAVAGLVAAGVDEMRHWDILAGWTLIAWAFVPLAILVGFTCPVRERTGRRADNGRMVSCLAVAGLLAIGTRNLLPGCNCRIRK